MGVVSMDATLEWEPKTQEQEQRVRRWLKQARQGVRI